MTYSLSSTAIRTQPSLNRFSQHACCRRHYSPKHYKLYSRKSSTCKDSSKDRNIVDAEEVRTGQNSIEGSTNREAWNNSSFQPDAAVPTAMDGVNWYCYTVLGLLFLADFTPIGASLQDSSTAVVTLAAVQWLLFVLPTFWFANSRQWDLKRTFKLEPCQPTWILGGLIAGAALFLVVSYAISVKSGTPFLQAGVDPAAQTSLVGGLLSRPNSPADWLGVLALVGVSPAVAEELLFRGFLLTSIQQRLGSIDAVSVCAALFSLIHLSVSQFFNFAVLGAACGLICIRSKSVFPAVSLHLGYNLTGLLLGIVLHS